VVTVEAVGLTRHVLSNPLGIATVNGPPEAACVNTMRITSPAVQEAIVIDVTLALSVPSVNSSTVPADPDVHVNVGVALKDTEWADAAFPEPPTADIVLPEIVIVEPSGFTHPT
jgi:hypothetical protein